jgi:hypothetical protein
VDLATPNKASLSLLTAAAPEIRTAAGRHKSWSHWVAWEAYPTLGSSSWRVQSQKYFPCYSSRSLCWYFESCMCSFFFISKRKTCFYTRKCYLHCKHSVASMSKLNMKAYRRCAFSTLDTWWRYAVDFAFQPLDPLGCRYWHILVRNDTEKLVPFTIFVICWTDDMH